jgi:hypothetical protein
MLLVRQQRQQRLLCKQLFGTCGSCVGMHERAAGARVWYRQVSSSCYMLR